ncbi:MAG: PAS domain-containing protein, partial [Deltaproteobacteria bacterium]
MEKDDSTYSLAEKRLREIGVPVIGRDPAEVAGKKLHRTYSRGDFQVDQEELERLAQDNPAGAVKIINRLVEHIALLRQSELAERESSERYQLALRGATLGMWEWFPQTGLNLLDDQGHRILGYTRDEVDESTAGFESMVHPDDRQKTIDSMIEHLQGNAPIWECEFRIITGGGDWKWLLSRGKVCEWDEKGNPWRVMGAFV